MGRTCGCDDCQSSRGRRKEFRQSAGLPEDEVPRKFHPKGKNKKAAKARPKKHKHVWVKVSYQEYHHYATGARYSWDVWYHVRFERDATSEPYLTWTSYFVCADCLDVKIERDYSKQRAWWRKQRRKKR